MLEQPSLLLAPWKPAAPGVAVERVRAVSDGIGTPLGFVRERPTRLPRWLRWFSRRTLEVFEAPDNSLLLVLRRGKGWFTSWHVLDADHRLVGKLRGRALLDGFGQFLAVREPPNESGIGRFLAIQGRELGEYAVERDGVRVMFANALEGNPFARMLVLGAVLVRDV